MREHVPPYAAFAAVYDRVMGDVDYERWTDYVLELAGRVGAPPRTGCDLACGTGNTTFPLARRGIAMIGVDASAEMLGEARRKAAEARMEIPLLQQDMREFALAHPVDLVVCLYDSLNYLLDEDAVAAAFRRVREALVPGGVFVFDVNTRRQLSDLPAEVLFIERDGVSLVWQNAWDGEAGVWTARLTGFRRRGRYFERFREVHRERAHPIDRLAELLAGAGLEVAACCTAFGFEPATEAARRVHFAARRPL